MSLGYVKQPLYPPTFRGRTSALPGRAGLVPSPPASSASINVLVDDGRSWVSADELLADVQLPDVITPGTYGSSTMIPVITVNSKGQVTAIVLVPAAGGSGATGVVVDGDGNTPTDGDGNHIILG